MCVIEKPSSLFDINKINFTFKWLFETRKLKWFEFVCKKIFKSQKLDCLL